MFWHDVYQVILEQLHHENNIKGVLVFVFFWFFDFWFLLVFRTLNFAGRAVRTALRGPDNHVMMQDAWNWWPHLLTNLFRLVNGSMQIGHDDSSNTSSLSGSSLEGASGTFAGTGIVGRWTGASPACGTFDGSSLIPWNRNCRKGSGLNPFWAIILPHSVWLRIDNTSPTCVFSGTVKQIPVRGVWLISYPWIAR